MNIAHAIARAVEVEPHDVISVAPLSHEPPISTPISVDRG